MSPAANDNYIFVTVISGKDLWSRLDAVGRAGVTGTEALK